MLVFLDRLVGASTAWDADRLLRARTVAAVGTLFAGLLSVRGVIFLGMGLWGPAAGLGLLLVGDGLLVLFLRRGGSARVGAHVLMTMGCCVVTALVIQRGGHGSAMTTVLAFFPLMATFLNGWRDGVVWLVVVVLVQLGLAGIELGIAPLEDQLDPGAQFPVDVFVSVVVGVLALALGVAFELTRAEARKAALAAQREHQAAELSAHSLRTERLATVGNLAAGVGHEINNPLTYMVCNLDFLREELEALPLGPGRASALRSIDEVAEGARRIAAITRELRSFTLGDTVGAPEAPLVPVALDEVVAQARALVDHEVRARGSLEISLEPDLWVRGRADALVQILVNLLLNAVQAVEGRADPRIRLGARRAGDQIQLSVSDNGPGVPLGLREQIFDPFFTSRASAGGTGLGLAVSRSMAEQMAGELSCGGGVGNCVFVLVLPAAQASEPDLAPAPEAAAPLPPLRVLVADDEARVAQSLARMMAGHKVTVVAGGGPALALLETGPAFDLILCDLVMPGIDGSAVHRWLATHQPERLDRFVAMTGGAFTATARAFLETCAVPILEKPVDPDELFRLLAAAADRARVGAEADPKAVPSG